VTYHVGERTSEADIERFFSSSCQHVVAIEHAWVERMRSTTLYIYEFDPENFVLQDACAGYYVSERTEIPIAKTQVDDLFGALFQWGSEVRLINNLWLFADAVAKSTLNFSICDMASAQPRKAPLAREGGGSQSRGEL
jgi:hypothetical protein